MSFLTILQSINLVVRFLLELGVLFTAGYWGFRTGSGWILKGILGIGLPIAIAVLWGTFGSPKATIPLSAPLHLLLEIVVFGLPVLLLYLLDKPALAAIFGLVVVVNRVLIYVWNQ